MKAINKNRIRETISYLRDRKGFIPIGARISENYSIFSLEGILKEKAKSKYKRPADTKTAPHIVDLLTLAGITELGYAKSSTGRKVQGVRLR